MFHKKTVLSLAVLGLILSAGIMGASAAYQGTNDNSANNMRPDNAPAFNQERRAEMDTHRAEVQTAIENNDYETWKSLMEESKFNDKILEVINADNFSRYVEMHQAMQNKDFDTAQAISEELGLPDFRGPGPRGGHFGKGNFSFKDNNGDGVCDNNDLEQ